jgi:hypothetical protein
MRYLLLLMSSLCLVGCFRSPQPNNTARIDRVEPATIAAKQAVDDYLAALNQELSKPASDALATADRALTDTDAKLQIVRKTLAAHNRYALHMDRIYEAEIAAKRSTERFRAEALDLIADYLSGYKPKDPSGRHMLESDLRRLADRTLN